MVATTDFRSCELCVHFLSAQVNRSHPNYEKKHGIRHQDHLFELNDTTIILGLDFGSLGWRPYWIPGHVNSACIFKCTSEKIMLKNMEINTKINFMGLIILKLCLFLILAILDVGHLENGFKKCLPDFSRLGS